jgi:cytidyltransferase-like protein
VELIHPKASENKGFAIVANDAYLALALRSLSNNGDVKVFVSGGAATTPSDISAYIADVYSRIYEEMQLNSVVDATCVVSGEALGSGLISKQQLRGLDGIEVIYSSEIEDLQSLSAARLDSGLSAIKIEALDYSGFGASDIFYVDGDDSALPTFKSVAIGGTFDRLHNGHRSLLTLAASCCSDTLLVGVTCAELLASKKNASEIYSFVKREKDVRGFLAVVKPTLKVQVTGLKDTFGPTATQASVEAVVVSSETIAGAQKINAARQANGIAPLKIIVLRRRDAVTLSSTFLRRSARRNLLVRAKNRVKRIFGGIFGASS